MQRQTSRVLTAGMILLLCGVAVRAAKKAPFAMIDPALVQGNFHQYPPFYGTVIAPHAVEAKGKVFCAFPDTKGRPIAMAYAIDAQTWSGPVTASDFGLGKDAHGDR